MKTIELGDSTVEKLDEMISVYERRINRTANYDRIISVCINDSKTLEFLSKECRRMEWGLKS